MLLALRTHIPMAVWRNEDERTVMTALELLEEADKQDGGDEGWPED